jgi:hypothetical protein
MPGHLEYCGETFPLCTDAQMTIGRDADVVIDENPFLHRRFLKLHYANAMWWISNIGNQLSATLSDQGGAMQAWLAPGGKLPLVFPHTSVWFTAGPTTYEFEIFTEDAPFVPSINESPQEGTTTTGRVALTPDQRLLLIALAEPMLKRKVRGAASVPSSADAAARLGWPLTKFNRKLDSVCQKLERLGVRGLHGGPEQLASNRRARLVEYALAARLAQQDDLALLGEP